MHIYDSRCVNALYIHFHAGGEHLLIIFMMNYHVLMLCYCTRQVFCLIFKYLVFYLTIYVERSGHKTN